jgi:hypothetical protein
MPAEIADKLGIEPQTVVYIQKADVCEEKIKTLNEKMDDAAVEKAVEWEGLAKKFLDRFEEIADDEEARPMDVIRAGSVIFDRVYPKKTEVHKTERTESFIAELRREEKELIDRGVQLGAVIVEDDAPEVFIEVGSKTDIEEPSEEVGG